jgi:hypothetical protein
MATVRRGSSNGSRGSRALRRTPNTRAIAAAVIGNALEWYDFVVFSFMTVVIYVMMGIALSIIAVAFIPAARHADVDEARVLS